MVEEEMNCKEDNSLRNVVAGLKRGEKMSSKVGAPTTLQDDAPTLSTKTTTATANTNAAAVSAISGCSKVNNNTLADGIPSLSAATSDTTCSIESTKTTATNNNNHSYSTTDMLPDEVKNVLSLSFPRCSVCDTDWYNYKEDEGEDKDTKMPAKTTESRKRKRNTSTTRQRPSHYTLYPMPKCQCSTRLAMPHDINLPIPPSSKDTNNNNNKESPTNTLSKISTHTFSNLAMCKCCLQKSLQTSNEIVIHDYRQSHIKDGQPDVKFTVDTKCTICSQKFLPRQLMRLLATDEEERGEKKSGATNKKRSKPDINWYNAVETTIQLVGWGKKHQRRERKQSRKKRAKMTSNVKDDDDDEKRDTWWANHDGFTGGGGNYSSDDCYSYSSDDNDSDDDDNINYYSHKRSSNVHRISTKKGELLNELLSKDPKLKQELDDAPYAKKLQDEEEERRLAAEAQEEKDREFAEKMQKEMQQEIDEQEKKRKKTDQKKESAKTRGTRRKSSPIDNPIFNAWSASAKKKKAMKKSPLKQQQLDECLLPQTSSAKKQQSVNDSGRSKELQHEQPVPQSSAASSTSTTNQLEDSVQTIVAMGFNNEEAARQCLNDADGNVQRAIAMLLSGASGSNK